MCSAIVNSQSHEPVTAVLTVLGVGLYLLLTFGSLYLIYFCLTLPLRRAERARMFLRMLELGLREGRTPEQAIVAVSQSRDPSLGARFHLLAALIEQGASLDQALAKVPRLLPLAVRGLVTAGHRIGDLGRVLPACQGLTTDAISQIRGALNYMILVTMAMTPALLGIPILLRHNVLPRMNEVFVGMLEGAMLPAFTRLVFSINGWFLGLQAALVLLLWFAVLCYAGGPRVGALFNRLAPGLPDSIATWFPWRRKRLQRNFSALLAILLDAGVNEAEAVKLAGECSGNSVALRWSAAILRRLADGRPLPQALEQLDGSGELAWRMRNATHAKTGFLPALRGWHEFLDAKAFQQEQAAAQITTSALVLYNGFIAGCVAIAMFLTLVQIIQTVSLW